MNANPRLPLVLTLLAASMTPLGCKDDPTPFVERDDEQGSCQGVKDGDPCDDGLFCTVDATCDSGLCVGQPRNCADLDGPCSLGACAENLGACVSQPANEGLSCDDQNPDTVNDTCAQGACLGARMADCAFDGHCAHLNAPCLEGFCDIDVCSTRPAHDGDPCDDGLFCTVDATCDSGLCVGQPRDCADLDGPCSLGACAENLGACVSQPANEGLSCDDGLFCTTHEQCSDGACVGGAPLDCSELTDQCNEARCDEQLDTCAPTPIAEGDPCDDGDDLTVGETCRAGLCGRGAPIACQDNADCAVLGDDCNRSLCDLNLGTCQLLPINNGQPCSDGLACTTGDRCALGVCVGAPVICPDSRNPCTAQQCAPDTGACVELPDNQGGSCDDANACIQGERCAAGACGGGTPLDCSAMNSPCLAAFCDLQTGACATSPVPDNTSCDDGDPLTPVDSCVAGRCVGRNLRCAADADCDDSNACTIDACIQGRCSRTNAARRQPCDDNLFCTVGDACNGSGVCTASPRSCGDPHACTADTCDEAADRCLNRPNDALCDNSSFCDGAERCSADAGCLPGLAPCANTQTCNELIDACTGINPDSADEVAFQATLALYLDARYAEAIAAFEAFLQSFPDSQRADNAQYLVARSHFELGDFALARDLLLLFIADAPDSILQDEAHYFLARSQRSLGQLAQAAASFEFFLVTFPNSPLTDNGLYHLGLTRFDLGQYDLAIAAFNAVIALPLSPHRPAALLWAGRSQYEQANLDGINSPRFDAADAFFDQLFNAYPDSVYEDNARFYHGMTAYQRDNYPLAIERLSVLRANFPASLYTNNAHYFIARSHYLQDNNTLAIAEFESYLAAYPGSPYDDNARFYAGRAHYQEATAGVTPAENFQAAASHFQLVISLHPTSGYADNAFYNLVRTQARMPDCPAALQTMSDFRRVFPTSPLINTAQTDLDSQGC